MTNNTKIDFKFFNWGPLLIKFKVSDNICDELMRRAEKLIIEKDDARINLVANIEKSLTFRDEDKNYFVTNTEKIFNTYLDHRNSQWVTNPGISNKKPIKQLFMNALWINYMKKNDFSPPHEHYGDLSFVLFCDVPDELRKEYKNNITTSSGPGTLNFNYGDGLPQYINSNSFFPEKGDFFIFPSRLQHWVHPFKSDITRISIAGNMEFQY